MKKFILICLTTLLSVAPLVAADFQEGGLYYNVLDDGVSVEVAQGDDYTSSKGTAAYVGDIVIPETVTHDGTTYTVTQVGTSAFRACTGMTSITFSSTITTLSQYACYGCTGLTSVTIPVNITSIANQAFYNDTNIQTLIIEDSDEDLNMTCSSSYTPFKNTGIVTLYWGRNIVNGNTYSPFRSNTNIKDVTIGPKVTSVNTYAFYGCTAIEEITIPETVLEIGSNAFNGCKGLKEIIFPNTITEIGSNMCVNCTALTSATIGPAVTSIGTGAFSTCTSLTQFTSNTQNPPTCGTATGTAVFKDVDVTKCTLSVPTGSKDAYATADTWKDFTSVEEHALTDGNSFEASGFYYTIVSSTDKTVEVTWGGESNMAGTDAYTGEITIPATATYNGDTYNVIGIGEYAFNSCKSLTKVTLPESVTYVNYAAFGYCESLTEVNLSKVSTMGSYAFGYCSALTSVDVSALTSIEEATFEYCTELTSVTLGSALTSIGKWGFLGCTKIEEIALPESATTLGYSTFYNCSALKTINLANVTTLDQYTFDYCSSLTSIDISKVTTIPEGAFMYCSKLSSVTFGEGLTSVEKWGFCGCTVLDATLPGSVTYVGYSAFYNCPALTEAYLPSVTEIDEYAFCYDYALETAYLGEGLTKIGTSAFYNCSKLESVTSLNPEPPTCSNYAFSGISSTCVLYVPAGYVDTYKAADTWKNFYSIEPIVIKDGDIIKYDGIIYKVISAEDQTVEVTYYGESYSNNEAKAYYTGDITIPASLEYMDETYTVIGVGDYAFYQSGVSSISFTTPSNVTYIGYRAIYNCTAITELTLPEGLTEVGDQAIRQCTRLKTFTLPETVVSLGGYMCYDNTALEKIVIPESVTTLGMYAYYNCSGATELTISSNITDWGSHAFYKCNALTSVEIPEGITEVGEYAFGNCEELVSVSIPDAVTTLGAHTFAACPKLESCVLPESMTEVDGYLFYNCPSLTEVTIGSKAENFGASVFAGCPALVAIYSLNPTPPSAPSSTFADTTVKTGTTDKETCVLYIPVDSYDDYSTADEWKDFFNIVEMTEFAIETLEATNVTDSSATLNGSVTEAYNDPITEKGFEYWTGNEEALKAVVEGDEMTTTVDDLESETTYTYRAYAIMESGITEYGEEQTFITEDVPTGINGIRISIDDENVEGIYSTSGQKLNTTVKGVNIIRYNDGTVKKLYVK